MLIKYHYLSNYVRTTKNNDNSNNKNDNKKCDMACASLQSKLFTFFFISGNLSFVFVVVVDAINAIGCRKARETDKRLGSTQVNFIGIEGTCAEIFVSRRRKSEKWTLLAYLPTCTSNEYTNY